MELQQCRVQSNRCINRVRMRIVITGSSSGIGHVLSGRLVEEGHDVWGIARRNQCKPTGDLDRKGNFRCSVADVSKAAQLLKVASKVAKNWTVIDGLITCAAIQGPIGPATAADPEQWSETIRTVLDGTFNAIKSFFPLLEGSGHRGKVICFSGGGATTPRPNFSAYAAAKAGVVRLVETLAGEWRDRSIDINAVAPGALPTTMTEQVLGIGPEVSGAEEHASAKRTSARGNQAFDQIYGLIRYLLSETSDGISGKLISAEWDDWPNFEAHKDELNQSDIFTLRRITLKDRGLNW
jgi:NAD(P)-dependent dehydrogenase (short-subunit alcohol dehydrogenase family)